MSGETIRTWRKKVFQPDKFRAARKSAGISQSQLARVIGVNSGGVIWEWEAGLNAPSPSNLYAAIHVIGISIYDVIDTSVPRPETYAEQEALRKERSQIRHYMQERFSGAVLRCARIEVGLSSQQLAKIAGSSASNIICYENGSKKPSVRTINSISNALGLRPEDLMETDPPTPLPIYDAKRGGRAKWVTGR